MVLACAKVVHVGSILLDLVAKDAVKGSSGFEKASVGGFSLNSRADLLGQLTQLLVVGAQGQIIGTHVVSRCNLATSSGEHFSFAL